MKVDLWAISLAVAFLAAVIAYNVTATVGGRTGRLPGPGAIESVLKKSGPHDPVGEFARCTSDLLAALSGDCLRATRGPGWQHHSHLDNALIGP